MWKIYSNVAVNGKKQINQKNSHKPLSQMSEMVRGIQQIILLLKHIAEKKPYAFDNQKNPKTSPKQSQNSLHYFSSKIKLFKLTPTN